MGNTSQVTLEAARPCAYCGVMNEAGSKGVLNLRNGEYYGFDCHRKPARMHEGGDVPMEINQ